jgi:hypothetical protein
LAVEVSSSAKGEVLILAADARFSPDYATPGLGVAENPVGLAGAMK